MRDDERYLDLAKFRDRVAPRGGREFWRSLDELCDDPEFEQVIRNEFPAQAAVLDSGVDRRGFLKLMGASLAFGGLTACTRPLRTIVPYVKKPEDTIPGRPLFFATAMTMGGVATGLLVESHMGRPTKVEGNPSHPDSLGATDAFAQASVLSLYDPDRSQTVRHLGNITTWNDFLTALQPALAAVSSKGGAGLRILAEATTSPTLGGQIDKLLTKFPAAKWHQYEPANSDNAHEGSKLAFGSYANTVYHFDKADIVLSLDADFLGSGPGHLRSTRDFMDRRRVRSDKREMNRLYAVESSPTPTGAFADHRLPMKASSVEPFARALAAKLGAGGDAPAIPERQSKWLEALARDLTAHRSRSIVVAGEAQPPAVHALAHVINATLGNAGTTVSYTDPLEARPESHRESLAALARDIDGGQVELLMIMGGNPVFDAPADLAFAKLLEKVALRIHLGLYYDETAALCHWHLPETHFLESWGDARAFDGTVSIVQPLIAPLYGGHAALEILGMLTDDPNDSYGMVREYWRAKSGAVDFETTWKKWLNDGVVAGTAFPVKSLTVTLPPPAASVARTGLEINFRPDPTIYDGRFANNGWLQELPKPLTKITWDNAALMSPATAARLGLSDEQVVTLTWRGNTLRMPVWRQPGHPDDSVTVHFGYGRTRGGRVANGTGFNAYLLRTSDAPWFGDGLEIAKTIDQYKIASTQTHQALETKDYDRTSIVRSGTLAELIRNPEMFKSEGAEGHGPKPTFYNEWKYPGYAWGMVIDTNVCTGCNGCVIACQSENNISVVGKEQVLVHREMQWIRIDHYYKGTPEEPQSFHQPMLCQHCENAPCEPVCPVEATTHSEEGINEMTYNRCVGTRYCANNCPYKVRRFNFLQYADYDTPSLALMRNPDVTVRSRGVMEKCTYCVQRVNSARIDAERDGRKIADGELVTACQQSCPSQAIVFGNINDPESRIAKLRHEPQHYKLLEELNTEPRTTYLASFRNPNPEIEA